MLSVVEYESIRLLFQIYKALHDRESKAVEDRLQSQREKTMQDCFIATDPIGSDRHGSLYWLFTGDDNRVFVQQRTWSDCSANGNLLPADDDVLRTLCLSRPSREISIWKVYSCAGELVGLCEALDDRGERERALKRALLARFDLDGSERYSTTGSDFIGKKVYRKFGKKVGMLCIFVFNQF
jgi:hypothetical protein